jgi:hypothetical protein
VELNRIISSFEVYHNVLVETLFAKSVKCDQQNVLAVIGQAYLKLLDSDKQRLSLKIPVYNERLLEPIVEYILNLDLLLRILRAPKNTIFQGSSIFEVLSHSDDNSVRVFLEFIKILNF